MSCVGKLFTGIISNRLNKYAEKCDLIRNTQAGFRKNHSTIDHIFVMYSLIEMLGSKSKQLFAAFIDLKQAFDTIWRDGLWYKVVNCNITGKCYKLIQNMYQGIKSCLTVNGVQTDYFSCNIGLRQGENLSPFLFFCVFQRPGGFLFSSPEPSGSQGELIVYPCSVVRPSSVRPSSVVHHFQRSSPLKPLGQSKPNFT